MRDADIVLSSTVCLCDIFLIPNHTSFQFGFRKWKGDVTERPIEDRSDVVKELHSDLSIVKPREGLFVSLSLHLTTYHCRPTWGCYWKALICIYDLSSLSGSVFTIGNIIYVFLFGWWISLTYFLMCPVMFLTVFGAPYGMYPKSSNNTQRFPWN